MQKSKIQYIIGVKMKNLNITLSDILPSIRISKTNKGPNKTLSNKCNLNQPREITSLNINQI